MITHLHYDSIVLLRDYIILIFCGNLVLSIFVEVFIVNLFYIFLLDSETFDFYWISLARRKAVALANFFKLSTLLFLHPSIVVYEVADPIETSLPL